MCRSFLFTFCVFKCRLGCLGCRESKKSTCCKTVPSVLIWGLTVLLHSFLLLKWLFKKNKNVTWSPACWIHTWVKYWNVSDLQQGSSLLCCFESVNVASKKGNPLAEMNHPFHTDALHRVLADLLTIMCCGTTTTSLQMSYRYSHTSFATPTCVAPVLSPFLHLPTTPTLWHSEHATT